MHVSVVVSMLPASSCFNVGYPLLTMQTEELNETNSVNFVFKRRNYGEIDWFDKIVGQ